MSFLRVASRFKVMSRLWSAPNQQRSFHISSSLGKIMQFKLSDIGEGIAEVDITEWHVKVGDKVNEFDEICVVQSDKASVTITSRYEGVIKKLYYNVDDVAKVGEPLIDIDTAEENEESVEKPQIPKAGIPQQKEISDIPNAAHISSGDDMNLIATPSVRKILRENNLDASKIKGTGRDGRLLKEDVLNFLGKPTANDSQVKSTPFIETQGEDSVVPIRGYRSAMIKSMAESLKIPHFGFSDEYSMDKLIEARNELNEIGKIRGIKCSYMPLFIKATSLALAQFPIVNSSLDGEMKNLIYKKSHNISLAMDTPGGLVVPNIKSCNRKSVWEIAAELDRLLKLGREQNLSKDDLSDGTFCISNVGAIGSGTYVSPVIFSPQVAIVALGRIQNVPRFDSDGSVVAKSIINASFAADHRVVDGATMARFSIVLKEYIEKPSKLIGDLH